VGVPGEAAYASIFIARLLGPLIVVMAVALLAQPDSYRAILKEFIHSPALCYLAGFLGLLGGIALVLVHNAWTADWRVVITLIGWITIARGALTLLWPQGIAAIGARLFQTRRAVVIVAVADLALGLFVSYLGYANVWSAS
jgi:uncharacterized membrane protein